MPAIRTEQDGVVAGKDISTVIEGSDGRVSPARRRAMLWALGLLAGAFLPPVRASASRPLLVLPSSREGPYGEVLALLKAHPALDAATFLAPGEALPRSGGGLLLTLGPKALDQAIQAGWAGQTLVGMVAARDYRERVQRLDFTWRRHASILLLEHPWARQVRLVRTLLPRAQRLGVLVSDRGGVDLDLLRGAADGEGLEIETRVVTEAYSPQEALRALLSKVDALLAVPDAAVFQGGGVAGYLLAAYRARVPVLAFSPGLVDAGALAAVYSSPGDIALDLTDRLGQPASLVEAGGKRIVPAHFTVRINQSLRRSLELPRIEVEAVERALKGGAT